MGQGYSTEEKNTIKEEIYAYYPGLEQQLEMAFTAHELSGSGRIELGVADGVLRHLLMQYGLIEYVTRFCTQNGELDMSHVKAELAKFKVKGFESTAKINLNEFKIIAVCWLRKILDTFRDDQIEWAEKLNEQREEQSRAYHDAMTEFQANFNKQQIAYKQGMLEQQKQILEWNQLIEQTQKSQQEMYDQEVKRLEEIEWRKQNKERLDREEHLALMKQYQQKLLDVAREDTQGICFVYPASNTPFGACASAGAQEPTRRRPAPRTTQKVTRAAC